MKNIYILVSFILSTPSLLIADALPYREQAEGEVCEGVRYIHPAHMKVMAGTKKCLADMSGLKCTESRKTNCVALAPFQAVAISSIDPAIIKKGETILGVLGTLDHTYQNPVCSADMQTNCQIKAPFKAAVAARIVRANFKEGESVLGLTGNFGDPDPVADCTHSLSTSCFAKGKFKAVANTELVPGHIKNGVTIGPITGSFPSVDSPMDSSNAARPQLKSSNFNQLLGSSAAFSFYDSHGKEYVQSGSAELVAANIANGETIFGVLGTAQPLQNIDFNKVRMRADLYGGQGKIKTGCRNGFPSGTAPDKHYPSIADNGSSKPTVFKGSAENSCHEELWENVTYDGGGNVVACSGGNTNCEYRDKQTGLIWRKDIGKNKFTRDVAASRCAQFAASESKPWRLPTLKEWQQAYVHGIRYIAPNGEFLDETLEYWSSSSMRNSNPTYDLLTTYLKPGSGETFGYTDLGKTANYMCVR